MIAVIGGLVLAGLVVLVIMVFREGDNPGRAACDHIEELADKEPERWDRFVNALARTVEARVWDSVKHERIEIHADSRHERCTESFTVIRESLAYSKYTSLAECISKITSWRGGSACFTNF
ncbi:MAG: hypothetical protein ABI867_03225 [Kofleriaceae bacterium]